MSDAVAIAAELPLQQQVVDYARHLTRSLPPPVDGNVAREFVAQFEEQVKAEEGQEVSEEARQSVVKSLVAKTVELKGSLEASKDSDAESSHLLLQHLITSTFEPSSSECNQLLRSTIDSVKQAGATAASSSRNNKLDTACRILNNTYNLLPSSSPLRPHALIALLFLLSQSGDLSALTLTSTPLSASLSQWSIPDSEKVSFLSATSGIYASAGLFSKALEIQILALSHGVTAQAAERALAIALADTDRFVLEDILAIQGVKETVSGKMAEVVKLFEETDEVAAVKQGQNWVSANGPYLESLGITSLNGESVLRKLRLVALTTLAANSQTQQIKYQEVASALQIDMSEVETWVLDAIRASLVRARLSQPDSLIRITYVSSHGTRSFGSTEWQLLEKRLTQWQSVVNDARQTVQEAEELSAQGPLTHRPRAQQHGQSNRNHEEAVTA